ncbi:hypothetical protein [Alistipes sp. ZOR0009]|uniref:hypothetical protein n=1 Tax=Alistipes sp. ZOR0009 TaxID=1339253 RepID=UPI000AB793FC|nr:hypothetical protein [Alistipes sp. ZOR0009]
MVKKSNTNNDSLNPELKTFLRIRKNDGYTNKLVKLTVMMKLTQDSLFVLTISTF